MYDLPEKRKFARVALKSNITLRFLQDGKPQEPAFYAIGKNMGVEGVLLASEKKLAPGKMLSLNISFPGEDDPVEIQGQIRWCAVMDPAKSEPLYLTGVQFSEITHKHLRLLIKNVCGTMSVDNMAYAV
ncbi:MAG: PilZ domain-containing protein [Candidatus Omnitrophica bacterium]|nr:PilZ domain-containing protein [Candidatus Omnitrophota bacterium]